MLLAFLNYYLLKTVIVNDIRTLKPYVDRKQVNLYWFFSVNIMSQEVKIFENSKFKGRA